MPNQININNNITTEQIGESNSTNASTDQMGDANPINVRTEQIARGDDKKEKARRSVREYYRKNKEAIKLKKAAYRLKNRETIKEKLRQYRLKNKPALILAQRQHYLKNKALVTEKTKSYKTKNKEAIKEKQREYRLNHLALYKEHQLAYRLKNKEARKQYYRNNIHYIKHYYAANKLKILLQQRLYRRNNKEALEATRKKSYAKNKVEILNKQREYYYMKRRKPRTAKGWKDPEEVREFFVCAGERLFVKEAVDWYRISRSQIADVGGASIFGIFGNLGKALKFAFPEVEWDQSKFSNRGKKSMQRWLKVVLKQVFPQNIQILEDFLHPELFWDEQNKMKMELDIWIPEFQIALEYQGEHHFHDLCSAYGPSGTVSLYSKRDEKKKQSCLDKGITFITIPYWWDGKQESLSSTLHQILPQIFPKTDSPPIPTSPPNSPRKNLNSKKDQIVTLLMHGTDWDRSQDPTGWYISEKLDGYRAFWDGSKLYSRHGNVFPAPLEFTRYFPSDVCLDGELWVGYEQFSKLSAILKKTASLSKEHADELWKDVKYCVFDAPMHPGHYIERHTFLTNSMSCQGHNISVVPIVQCMGLEHLQAILDETKKKNGEGVMLYDPTSKYTSGRTTKLLKVKVFSEEDVVFVNCNPNSYSFLCEQKNGTNCIVKCSGWDYLFPPSPGTVLTVKHSGIYDTTNRMKHPFLLKIRNDMNWNQIQQK